MKIDGESCACDYCGDHMRGDFTYYSFDFKLVQKIPNGWRESKELILSADLCERCIELFKQRLLSVAANSVSTSTRCDVSGYDCCNDSAFYKCHIAKVVVNISGQPYICLNCKKARDPQQGPCECDPEAGRKLFRDAKVEVDDSYADLNFGATMYAKFNAHIQYIKGLGETEWTK